MPKHDTRNRSYLITLQVHTLVMKSGQFMYYDETKNFIKKLCNNKAWKLALGPFVITKNWAQPNWKMKFLSKSIILV